MSNKVRQRRRQDPVTARRMQVPRRGGMLGWTRAGKLRCICSQGERSLRTTTSHPALTFTATLGLSPRHYMFAVPTGAAVTQAPTPTLHLHPYTSTSTSTSTHPAIAHTTTALPDFKILQLPISSGSPRWTTFFVESEINTLQVRSLIPQCLRVPSYPNSISVTHF